MNEDGRMKRFLNVDKLGIQFRLLFKPHAACKSLNQIHSLVQVMLLPQKCQQP